MPCAAIAADYPAPDAYTRQVIESFPAYSPSEKVSGEVRLWGHGSFKRDFMGSLFKEWIRQFQLQQPDVTFQYLMYGTASAVGALYTGAGDIALLGEEISPAAARAFLRAKGYPHTDISVATGSVDVNFYDYAHMVFVHRSNPLEKLSLRQLDAIFGAGQRANADIRRWGGIGLGGSWRDAPIQPYGWRTDVDFALFFRERVLADNHRWNPEIREFEHATRADGSQYDHGQRILDALADDPHGIAISNIRYLRPEVKPVALAWSDEAAAVHATPATLIDQSYPLVRIIPAIVDQPPGEPMKPAVREFLRFVLSREGQSLLVSHSGYLPLGKEIRERQWERIR